jgi:chromosome partitioning protein
LTVITLANQKGGTGKTTLATNLAGCFARAGRRVVIADSDPQGSAMLWQATRPQALPRVPVSAVAQTPERLRLHLRALAGYDIVLLDTGGRIAPGVRQAVALADFVLVPTLPSVPDVRSTEAFYRQVLAEIARTRPLAGGIVLNGMQPWTRLSREAEDYIRGTDLPVFGAVVRQYQSFREAFGRGLTVAELGESNAARDIQALCAELEEDLR